MTEQQNVRTITEEERQVLETAMHLYRNLDWVKDSPKFSEIAAKVEDEVLCDRIRIRVWGE